MRGPLVYCLESADNPFPLPELSVSADSPVQADFRPLLLGGVTALRGHGEIAGKRNVGFTAVPYYAWANRGSGAMAVWIPESEIRK